MLFRDAEAIERLRTIDTLIVDKTGTLTEGNPPFAKSWRPTASRTTRCCAWPPASTRAANIRWPTPSWPKHADADWRWTSREGFDSVTGIGVRGQVGGRALALGNRR